jgi:hemerythrin-like metal-binding protein
LREVVGALRAAHRSGDTLCRWGGEEFVLLMPYTAHASAATVAERLRAQIEAKVRLPDGSRVTASAGVAELLSEEAADDFFKRLDRLLYAAKEGGRNRIVVHEAGASDAWVRQDSGLVRLVWRQDYESGHGTIDSEHRRLFDLANAAIAASLVPAGGRGELIATIDRLFEHAAAHFTSEEALLASVGYPRLAQHHEAHEELLRRASELRREAARGEGSIGQLVNFLARDLVARHLLVADRDFFPLIASRQGAAP